MVALSIVALCVFIFGAYAYGATVVLALRAVPVWGNRATASASLQDLATRERPPLDSVSLTMCIFCTAWFVGHAFAEFRVLTGGVRWEGWSDLMMLIMSYGFPPLIMHTVLKETHAESDTPPPPLWRHLLVAMYVLCFAVALYMILSVYRIIPRPQPFGAYAGVSVGALFVMCSVYCMVMILRRPKRTPDRSGLRRTMTGLFLLVIVLLLSFNVLILLQSELLLQAADRFSRMLPIFFLITSVYFENRF